jgi:hypothetical protein
VDDPGAGGHASRCGPLKQQPEAEGRLGDDRYAVGGGEGGRKLGREEPQAAAHEVDRARDRQGVLAVSIDDERLSWPERELVRQLGEKLYGPRNREADAPEP